mgnify:FL=1|jgi:hypothetical protein
MKKDIDWQVCRGLPTRCYRNLNTGLMSLTQQIDKSWIVVGHTDNLVIRHPKLYVSQRGRQRVLKDGHKNVHAYAQGVLEDLSLSSLPRLKEIYYCPYSQAYFSWKETGEQIASADLLVVIDNQVLCSIDTQQPQLTLF